MIDIIKNLQHYPPEIMSIFIILLSYGSILLAMRLFGLYGLVAVSVISLISANIQVIKLVKFSVFPYPVALGTELFSSTFLSTDIITEFYGKKHARMAIWLGFFCQILFSLVMFVTVSYRPINAGLYFDNGNVESSFETIFLPQIGLVFSGLSSYLISQNFDVTIYAWIKNLTKGNMLWLRNISANICSALLDNTIFSVLAWEVFTNKPVVLQSLIYTYILGTFFIRVFISTLDLPFLYASKYFYRHNAASNARS